MPYNIPNRYFTLSISLYWIRFYKITFLKNLDYTQNKFWGIRKVFSFDRYLLTVPEKSFAWIEVTHFFSNMQNSFFTISHSVLLIWRVRKGVIFNLKLSICPMFSIYGFRLWSKVLGHSAIKFGTSICLTFQINQLDKEQNVT